MADVEFTGANGEEQYMEGGEQVEQEYEQSADPSQNPGDKINASKNDEDNRAEGSQMDSSEKNEGKIFVGGLSWETTVKDLKEYFQKYGTVVDCTLKTDPTTGRSRGFGFVLFEDAESVEKVLAEKQHLLHGRNIDPKRAKARGGREPILKVFVGGLDPSVSEAEIKEYFKKFGKVTELDLPYDKQKGQRRAFCFVSFETEEIVDKVCEEAKQEIAGKRVDVKKATPKSEQYGGYGGYGAYGGRGGRGGYDGGRGRGRGRGRGGDGYNQGWGNQGYGNGGYGGYDYNNYGYGGYGNDYYGNYDYNNYYQGWGNQGGYGNYGAGYGSGYGDGTEMTAAGATTGEQGGGYKAKGARGGHQGYHPYSR